MKMPDPEIRDHPKLMWGLALIVGLVLETCFLAVLASIWISQREGTIPELSIETTSSTPLAIDQVTATEVVSSLPQATNTALISTGTLPGPEGTSEITLTPTITTFPATETPTATPWRPVFITPPPGKIVYVCFDGKYDQICLMNADGSSQKQLTDFEATSFYPSLSPDGGQVVFSSRMDGSFEIYLMDVNGGNLTQLTDNIGNLYAPEISPKGNRIVFTVEVGGNQAIWIMKLDGSNARPLYDSPGGDIDPTWSPDGSQVLFASDQSGATKLYVMNADGTRVHPVTTSTSKIGGRSDWSPNGFYLGFYAGSTGDHNLFFLEPNGRAAEQLTNGGDNLSPSFSPDNRWVVFTSFRDGNNEIYVMNLDSLETFRLTSNNRSDWQPRWGP